MEVNDMRELLRTNKIDYVFDGPEEKSALLAPSLYPNVLEVMYQNPEVTVYKVKKNLIGL